MRKQGINNAKTFGTFFWLYFCISKKDISVDIPSLPERD